MDRSFVTLALALAASFAAPAALADRNNPPSRGGDHYVAETADELRLAAEDLVKALGRERDPSTVRLIMSAGFLAKEASDLACAAGLRLQQCRQQPAGVRQEFRDVKEAFLRLKSEVRGCGRLGSRSEDLYQDVVYAFQDLRDAIGDGGGRGRDDDRDNDDYDDDNYNDDDNYDDDDYDDQGDDLDDYDDFYPGNNGPDLNRGGGH